LVANRRSTPQTSGVVGDALVLVGEPKRDVEASGFGNGVGGHTQFVTLLFFFLISRNVLTHHQHLGECLFLFVEFLLGENMVISLQISLPPLSSLFSYGHSTMK
jgi:hypothetical protein